MENHFIWRIILYQQVWFGVSVKLACRRPSPETIKITWSLAGMFSHLIKIHYYFSWTGGNKTIEVLLELNRAIGIQIGFLQVGQITVCSKFICRGSVQIAGF